MVKVTKIVSKTLKCLKKNKYLKNDSINQFRNIKIFKLTKKLIIFI